MTDLAKQANEAEIAFMQAARAAKSEADDKHVKALCREYLNVLIRIRQRKSRWQNG